MFVGVFFPASTNSDSAVEAVTMVWRLDFEFIRIDEGHASTMRGWAMDGSHGAPCPSAHTHQSDISCSLQKHTRPYLGGDNGAASSQPPL